MNKINKYLICCLAVVSLTACEKDFLEREPVDILTDEQVWNDPKLITGTFSNYYDRLPKHVSLTTGWTEFAAYDEAVWSGGTNNTLNNLPNYAWGRWGLWDYGLIRDINLSVSKLQDEELASNLTDDERNAFIAELRFLRAYVYFEHVKRMGGVPIITEELIYDFSGDPTYLQYPRAKEAEVYDFVAKELDLVIETMDALNVNAESKTRANIWTALALKSRAMLYAGSIAKYNNSNRLSSPIKTPGGEVGIPAEKADEYYQKSLDASRRILEEGPYSLYESNPHLGENFYEAIMTEGSNNTEVIWAQDFLSSADKRNWFTYDNIARSVREDNLGSSALAPSLNLVEDYEYLDGTPGEVVTMVNGEYVCYKELDDPFENRDWRLYGTVIYPGATFKGTEIEIQAGVAVWDEDAEKYNFIDQGDLGSEYEDGGLLTGAAGPSNIADVSNTGFYLRKYVSDKPGASTRGIRSENWWIYFRLGEIYLNAAEAAFELGQEPTALTYINRLRERAGFEPNSLSSLTFDQIRNERRVELAFEDHIVWDLKRWRLAHQVWNGGEDATLFALWPYRVIRPGHECDGQYIFREIVAPRFVTPRYFQLGNYYSEIGQGLLDANPKLVRNPYH